MGSKRISLEGAVKFTKLSVYLAYCWPPPPYTTKWQNRKFDILWSLSLLSSLALLAPLVISIYKFQDNPIIVTKSSIFIIAVSNFTIKIIVCRFYRKRTQVLIYEMLAFLKDATPQDRAILERYMMRCSGFHATLTIVYYLTASVMICGPVILPQPFPTDAVYPFSVTSPLVNYTIYIHQAFAGFQCSTGLTLDFQPALLLWYAGARLEMLACDAKNIQNKGNFDEFVKKHQYLLWYASEVKNVVRYVSFTTAAITGLGTAFGLLQLISNQPFLVKLQFATVVISSSMNLYTCAWPADNLATVCHLIGTEIYDSPWPKMPAKLMKDYIIVLRMCQRPVIISVAGFIPFLSLQYYGSFLSKAFSYFTTLRITMDMDAEK